VATNRTYDAIFRLAEAQAKLNLSNEVEEHTITQILQSLSLMLSQYGTIVKTVESPRDITYKSFLSILKQNKAALSIEELCKIACEENRQIHEYLGDKFKVRDNKKLRTIIDMLLNHGSIKQIQEHPIVLQWHGLGDLRDPRDPKTNGSNNDCDMKGEIWSPRSLGSLITDSNSESRLEEKQQQQQQIPDSIYRLGHSDTWACKNCKLTGDIHFMTHHICRGCKHIKNDRQ
jgi:hypothetical protein